MSDLLNEQLSALLDGELPAAETALLLKRLEREAALRDSLSRYRLCGETLRGARLLRRADFTLRVSAVLAAEPCHGGTAALSARRRPALRRYLRPLAGVAIAATVAGIAILVLGRPPALDGRPIEIVAAVAPPAAAPATAPATAVVTPPVRRAPESSNFAPNALALSGEPASYVTPAQHQGLAVIPRAELANYVVAHSEVSGPLGRHSVLMNLVSDEPGPAGTPAQ